MWKAIPPVNATAARRLARAKHNCCREDREGQQAEEMPVLKAIKGCRQDKEHLQRHKNLAKTVFSPVLVQSVG